MVHHMNDNSMFSSLVNYKNYSYYKNHKYIYFYTLRDGQTIESTYEIVIAFKTIAYYDKGITIDNRAITEDEIKKVLVYKDRIR